MWGGLGSPAAVEYNYAWHREATASGTPYPGLPLWISISHCMESTPGPNAHQQGGMAPLSSVQPAAIAAAAAAAAALPSLAAFVGAGNTGPFTLPPAIFDSLAASVFLPLVKSAGGALSPSEAMAALDALQQTGVGVGEEAWSAATLSLMQGVVLRLLPLEEQLRSIQLHIIKNIYKKWH